MKRVPSGPRAFVVANETQRSPHTFSFGHGGAFGTQGWVDPKTKTIYVLMIQRTRMGNSDGSEVRKAFQQAAHDALQL